MKEMQLRVCLVKKGDSKIVDFKDVQMVHKRKFNSFLSVTRFIDSLPLHYDCIVVPDPEAGYSDEEYAEIKGKIDEYIQSLFNKRSREVRR